MYLFVFFRFRLKIALITYHDRTLAFTNPSLACGGGWEGVYKPFQTNFDSNVAIRTFEACCRFAPPTQTTSHPRQQTNLFKLWRTFTPFPNALGKGWGWGYRAAERGVLSLRAAEKG
jgi:hypothetical protein